jgi:hypothetical protein
MTRRIAGASVAFAVIAGGAVVAVRAARPTPTVEVDDTRVAAAPPPTLVPGAPTVTVSIGTDKVLRVTDAPGNAALLFINETEGHMKQRPIEVDGETKPPDLSELTDGTITISSKDQIAISTVNSADGPVCKYVSAGDPALEDDPEVTHHVVCQKQSMSVRLTPDLWDQLVRTDLITSARVDLGDQDDSLTVRADPPPRFQVKLVETEAGAVYSPVEPHLTLLNDLQDWNAYGGTGNDWIDVNVSTHMSREVVNSGEEVGYEGGWHVSVATIFGGEGNDTLTGGRGADYIAGENGNDAIVDMPQGNDNTKDRLMGGAGNDTIDGRNGPDILDGGTGTDTFAGSKGRDEIYAQDGEADQIGCVGGPDTLFYDAGKDTLVDC